MCVEHLQQFYRGSTLPRGLLHEAPATFICPLAWCLQEAGPDLSSQASPTKRGLTLAAERLPPSSPAGSAPRRFANMLMSKLLRSTPNLQEAAEGRGTAESDSESEAASGGRASGRKLRWRAGLFVCAALPLPQPALAEALLCPRTFAGYMLAQN